MVSLRFVTRADVGCAFLRGRCDTLEASRNLCVFFSWQAQHFVLLDCRFSWQAQDFLKWRIYCVVESPWLGCVNVTECQKIIAGATFCDCFEKWPKLRKIHTFGAL